MVQGLGHLEPPVIPQVEHVPRLCLTPMLPTVRLDSEFARFSPPVNPVPGGFSDAVGLETRIHKHIVHPIKNLDLVIQKVNLLLLVYVVRIRDPAVVIVIWF